MSEKIEAFLAEGRRLADAAKVPDNFTSLSTHKLKRLGKSRDEYLRWLATNHDRLESLVRIQAEALRETARKCQCVSYAADAIAEVERELAK